MPVAPTKKSAKRSSPVLSPFVGRWIASDEWSTDVSLIIRRRDGKFAVGAVDLSDGEQAEIFGVKASKRELSFAAHWSSGQLTKYRLRPLRAGEMEVIFTHTVTSTYRLARKS